MVPDDFHYKIHREKLRQKILIYEQNFKNIDSFEITLINLMQNLHFWKKKFKELKYVKMFRKT